MAAFDPFPPLATLDTSTVSAHLIQMKPPEPEKVPRQVASRELGPGEQPIDALKWLERELTEVDRLISKLQNQLKS